MIFLSIITWIIYIVIQIWPLNVFGEHWRRLKRKLDTCLPSCIYSSTILVAKIEIHKYVILLSSGKATSSVWRRRTRHGCLYMRRDVRQSSRRPRKWRTRRWSGSGRQPWKNPSNWRQRFLVTIFFYFLCRDVFIIYFILIQPSRWLPQSLLVLQPTGQQREMMADGSPNITWVGILPPRGRTRAPRTMFLLLLPSTVPRNIWLLGRAISRKYLIFLWFVRVHGIFATFPQFFTKAGHSQEITKNFGSIFFGGIHLENLVNFSI